MHACTLVPTQMQTDRLQRNYVGQNVPDSKVLTKTTYREPHVKCFWSNDWNKYLPIETIFRHGSLSYCYSVVRIWKFVIHAVHGEENLVKNWHNFPAPEASCRKYDLTLTSYPDCRSLMMLRGWGHSSIIHWTQDFHSLSPCLPEEDILKKREMSGKKVGKRGSSCLQMNKITCSGWAPLSVWVIIVV